MMWTAPRIWEGETAAILAGGPSLRGFDAEVLRGIHVITINNSFQLCPWADLHYYCDQSWMDAQKGIDYNSGRWVKGGQAAGVDERVKVLRFTGQIGFDADPSCLRTGSNSLYQCLHLSAHLGATKVILLGADMKLAADGKSHWHSEPRPGNFAQTLKDTMLPLFRFIVDPLKRRGIEVVNSTPGSALKLWPFLPLESVLCGQSSRDVLTP